MGVSFALIMKHASAYDSSLDLLHVERADLL